MSASHSAPRSLWGRLLRTRADITAARANSEALIEMTQEVLERLDQPSGPSTMFPAQSALPVPDFTLRASVGPPAAFHEVALTTIGRLNMAGLRPDDDVLDVGCGCGRTARYLCDYLDHPDAHYEGIDVSEVAITWCQANITPSFPNFRFHYTPLFNTCYNPNPLLPPAATFRFPFPDESFDFVFAHSVFTHLVRDAAINYISEISRVLRVGGTSYTTWFLFDDNSSTYRGLYGEDFIRDMSGVVAVENTTIPEAAIAYSETWVREEHASFGLTIVDPIHVGFKHLQSAIVAVKCAPTGD